MGVEDLIDKKWKEATDLLNEGKYGEVIDKLELIYINAQPFMDEAQSELEKIRKKYITERKEKLSKITAEAKKKSTVASKEKFKSEKRKSMNYDCARGLYEKMFPLLVKAELIKR